MTTDSLAPADVRPLVDGTGRGPYRLSVAALAATCGIVLLGAQVTTTRAGDSVPTWPASFFVPANSHQWYELGHRWVAGLAGLLTVALTLVCLRRGERRPEIRRLAAWSAVTVVAQALLGGLRVRLAEDHPNSVPVAHTMLGQTFLAILTALTVGLSHGVASAAPASGGALRARSTLFVGVVWSQSLLGAIQRHVVEDRSWFAVVAHVVGAVATLVVALKTIEAAFADESARHGARGLAAALGGMLAAQVVLGVFALLVTRGEGGYVNPQDVSSLFPTLHTLNGAGILAVATAIAVRARRDFSAAAAA